MEKLIPATKPNAPTHLHTSHTDQQRQCIEQIVCVFLFLNSGCLAEEAHSIRSWHWTGRSNIALHHPLHHTLDTLHVIERQVTDCNA